MRQENQATTKDNKDRTSIRTNSKTTIHTETGRDRSIEERLESIITLLENIKELLEQKKPLTSDDLFGKKG